MGATDKGNTNEFVLEVEARDDRGKSAAKKMREIGRIPAIAYGNGVSSTLAALAKTEVSKNGSPDTNLKPGISLSVNARNFIRLAEVARSSQVFLLKSGDPKLNGLKALVQDIQRDFLKGTILHLDLQILDDSVPVRVKVPLKVSGDPVGVKTQGGVLTVSAYAVTVKCLPANIPNLIEIDVSGMQVGARIRTGDIDLPDGVVLRSNPLETVATVLTSRKSKEETDVEAAAAAAAGATAKPAATSKAA